jgi:hypothetical protein
MLDDLKPVMRDLVLKNEPVENRLRDLPQITPPVATSPAALTPRPRTSSGQLDWGQVAEKGLIGAFVGGLVAGLVLLWKGMGSLFRRLRGKTGDAER